MRVADDERDVDKDIKMMARELLQKEEGR